MNSTNRLRSLNLNHLPILREVLRHEGVTRAAEVLNLSQPAVSNILKSLRGHFDDDLIARDGSTMKRTLRGDELLVLLETSLSRMEMAVEGQTFSPRDATGPLRVATVDNLIGLVAGPMCDILAQEAPRLSVQFVLASHSLAEELKSGTVDIAVTSTEFINSSAIADSLRDELHTFTVASEPLVCIARASDEEFAEGLTLEQYLARPHASYTVDPDHPHTVERKRIRDFGLRRSTRVCTMSNQSLPDIVASSDCLAIVPISMALAAAKSLPIQYRDPPISLPNIEWVIVWHNRSQEDDLVQWAKEKTALCAQTISTRFRAEGG